MFKFISRVHGFYYRYTEHSQNRVDNLTILIHYDRQCLLLTYLAKNTTYFYSSPEQRLLGMQFKFVDYVPKWTAVIVKENFTSVTNIKFK